MLSFAKNLNPVTARSLRLASNTCPIGMDMGMDVLKLVQLGYNGKTIKLIAAGNEQRPADIEPGSIAWQRWAIQAVGRIVANNKFQGKALIAALPSNEVFIDHIRKPNAKDDDNLRKVLLTKIKQKLPFDDVIIKYILAPDNNFVVVATEQLKIERYLAVFERANLRIMSIAAWPTALINCYAKFFGRRNVDHDVVAMLLDIHADHTNIVICRHKNLMFAHTISIGKQQLETEQGHASLVLELNSSKSHFTAIYKNAPIERLIFLSGQAVDRNICIAVAKKLEMSTQIGDCLAAVEIPNPETLTIDRRQCCFSWATAFGLSLS